MANIRKKEISIYILVSSIMIIAFCLLLFLKDSSLNHNSNSNISVSSTVNHIHGNVYDEDLNPVNGIVLRLHNPDYSIDATTNEEGEYNFYEVPCATYTLSVWTLPSDDYLKVSVTLYLDMLDEDTYNVTDIILKRSDNNDFWGPLT